MPLITFGPGFLKQPPAVLPSYHSWKLWLRFGPGGGPWHLFVFSTGLTVTKTTLGMCDWLKVLPGRVCAYDAQTNYIWLGNPTLPSTFTMPANPEVMITRDGGYPTPPSFKQWSGTLWNVLQQMGCP